MNNNTDQRLLDYIYTSAWDAGALKEALQGLADTCRSRCAGLFHLRNGALVWEQSWNVPAGFMADFAANAAPQDPRVHFGLNRPPLTLMRDDEPAMRRAMRDTGVEGFTRDYDLPYTLSCAVARFTPTDALALYVSRSTGEGRPGSPQVSAFLRYAPHFARAMALGRRIRNDLAVSLSARTAGTTSSGPIKPTPRQFQVLALLAEGLMSKQIGAQLGISENTVRNHIQQLLRLFGVPTRTACVARARACGLLAD